MSIKIVDLGQDLLLVNVAYGLITLKVGLEVWLMVVTTGYIAPSVLGERSKYSIHLACGIVGWGSHNEGKYDGSEIYSRLYRIICY